MIQDESQRGTGHETRWVGKATIINRRVLIKVDVSVTLVSMTGELSNEKTVRSFH